VLGPVHLKKAKNTGKTAQEDLTPTGPVLTKSLILKKSIEADGSIVETAGECKQGIDLSYDGRGGYHPLLVSLANTQELLFLANRSGNRPSHEGAAAYLDRAAALCRGAGFREILLRGDTDFTQTAHLDRWDGAGIGFVFGFDAQPNLVALAAALPEHVWQTLERPARYEVATSPRQRPVNVKEEVVRRRGYRNLRLVSEQVAEFNYRPGACAQDYRIVVLRKRLVWERHDQVIEEETRYFFYITNRWTWSCAEVVSFANDRCNQENLVEQLKNGVRALRAPVNTLESNWAYMGDYGPGVEFQGVAGVVAAAVGPSAAVVDDGVQEVPGRGGLAALPDRAHGGPLDLPAVAVEPLGRRALPGQ